MVIIMMMMIIIIIIVFIVVIFIFVETFIFEFQYSVYQLQMYAKSHIQVIILKLHKIKCVPLLRITSNKTLQKWKTNLN